jgi:RNA polymerase sigma-70 factor (ECF subfamily)
VTVTATVSFKAWLLKLMRWRILNQFKKRLPEKVGQVSRLSGPSRSLALRFHEDETRTATVERVADPASLNIDAVWDREWERNLTEAAKEHVQQQVSAGQFQMFELYVVQGWPVREVARLLGVSAGQVYLAKHRVGGLLKKEVKRLKSRL